MAIDTHTKRRSVLGAFMVALTVLPVPDGTVDTQDRPHAAGLYAGVVIDTTVPLDFVSLEDAVLLSSTLSGVTSVDPTLVGVTLVDPTLSGVTLIPS